jgi:transposase-like protein
VEPLWSCPRCGRTFANRNQSHFCSAVRLEEHFAGKDPRVVATFKRLVATAAVRTGEESGL